MRRIPKFAVFMIAVAASVGSATPAPAQDPLKDTEDQVNAFLTQGDAKIDLYLAKHPVRPSPLFEAAARLSALLGTFDKLIIDACEYDPDFPDWMDTAGALHQNTILALGRSYEDALRNQLKEITPSEVFRDRSLCADEKRHRVKIARELQSVMASLRRQGY